MAIIYDKTEKLFTLRTQDSVYQMKVDPYGFLLHLYYGAPVKGSMEYLLTYQDRGFSGNPYEAGEDRTYSMDVLPQEYPCEGTGDYRAVCLAARGENGAMSVDLRYADHAIQTGKYAIPGLPAVYEEADQAEQEEVQTLEIDLRDDVIGLKVTLLYGVFPRLNIITRSEIITNIRSDGSSIELLKAQTACLDFLTDGYDLIQFYGRHAMERNVLRSAISHGTTVIGSRRGASSHQYNPFLIVAERGTTEDTGGCYGMSFVYSGNFKGEAGVDQFNQTRVTFGLSDELFSWTLPSGDIFRTPEVVMSYSGQGLGGLSRAYHRTYRSHLCRGKYRDVPRPVLINNWEATYFDFTGDKICEIAKQASELGVEMLVLDDGWFGERDTDSSGLGDWTVNEGKLGGSLKELVERVNRLGMKFGIWVEPEMVSEDSDLYRAHPDWAFTVPGRRPVRSRFQLVLDFSRPEVVDAVYEQISRVLDSANIEYMKWDMNRSIADAYSCGLGRERQGEVLHRYVLGLYDFLERVAARYPNLLIEGCSGGGGRFDAGMLYYCPQIWCSDNTDAIDRIRIQYGTSFGYPVSAVGSHVSASPNHQTGRITPMRTRGVVAMAGSFGYELDLNKITQEERELVREQIGRFRQYWEVIHHGDYYRLTNPYESEVAAWQFVTMDQQESLVNVVTLTSHGNAPTPYVRLKGLDPNARYQDEETGRCYEGSALMAAGIAIQTKRGEYQALQFHLTVC